jgi:hypothetical protein
VTRAALEQLLLDRLEPAGSSGAPAPFLVLDGPRGLGKSRLLQRLATRLAGRGALPATVPVDRIGASPEEVARQIVRCVDRATALAGHPPFPAESVPGRLAADLRERSEAPRPDAAGLLEAALAYPAAAGSHVDRPLTLVLDELGEIAPLSRHAGLRGLDDIMARALAGAGGGPVLASVAPASRPGPLLKRCEQEADAVGRPFARIDVEPWTEQEMGDFLFERSGYPLPADAVSAWLRATAGRPLYASILARRALGPGRVSLAEALASEMTSADGLLHRECRFDYHLLVERSRGKAVVRSILSLVAHAGEVNLTAVARHVRTSLPTATDYLSWMMEVGLLRRERLGYHLADPLLGMWLRLNGPEEADPLEEAVRVLEGTPAPSPEAPASSILLPPASPPSRSPRPGGDFPMEID